MVECHLAKVDVEGSSPFSRSKTRTKKAGWESPSRLFSFRRPPGCDPVSVSKADVVRGRRGLPVLPPGYFEARARLFPHAELEVRGGCVERDEAVARVRHCPACRRALRVWSKRHPPPPDTMAGLEL